MKLKKIYFITPIVIGSFGFYYYNIKNNISVF